MSWLYENINHLTVPLGMFLAICAALGGFMAQRKRKAGVAGPYVSDRVRNAMIAVLVLCAVLLGFAIAKNMA